MVARRSSCCRFRPPRGGRRAAAIGATVALAGVFLLETADRRPGSANRQSMVGLSSVRVGKRGRSLAGLTLEEYDGVVRRALASIDNDDAAEEIVAQGKSIDLHDALDYEKIARRVLEEESPAGRSLSSDNPNYEIIEAAQNIRKGNPDRPFLFVMEATVGMVPMIKSWICNTQTMEGVHENTLLIVDEPGKKLLDAFEPAQGLHVVFDSFPELLYGSWDYGTLGYWRMTQNRFHTILDIIELGNVPVMIIEPDAVWLDNPLDDPDITDSDADVVCFSDGVDVGKTISYMGFGFLRLNPTDTVINLLTIAGKSVDETLTMAVAEKGDVDVEEDPSTYVGKLTGEQTFFSRLAGSFDSEHPDRNFVHVLPNCRYPSGKWYVSPLAYNYKCSRNEQGSIVVLQNNWIIGNEVKVKRAKTWGQWFVPKEEDRCINTDLNIARQGVESGIVPKQNVPKVELVTFSEV